MTLLTCPMWTHHLPIYLLHYEDTKEDSFMEAEPKPLSDTESALVLILEFLSYRTVRDQFVAYKLSSLKHFVSAARPDQEVELEFVETVSWNANDKYTLRKSFGCTGKTEKFRKEVT